MLQQLKAWYLKTFLPYEAQSHPLFSDGSTKYDNELLQDISDWVDAEVEAAPYQLKYTVSSDPDNTKYL